MGPRERRKGPYFFSLPDSAAIPGSGIRPASYAPQRAFPRVKAPPLGSRACCVLSLESNEVFKRA
jgi:hypothetical protein